MVSPINNIQTSTQSAAPRSRREALERVVDVLDSCLQRQKQVGFSERPLIAESLPNEEALRLFYRSAIARDPSLCGPAAVGLATIAATAAVAAATVGAVATLAAAHRAYESGGLRIDGNTPFDAAGQSIDDLIAFRSVVV